MDEPLTKDLGFGISALLGSDGTLTLAEGRTGYTAMEEKVMTFTELTLPPQAARALLNLLRKQEARKRIHYRKVR